MWCGKSEKRKKEESRFQRRPQVSGDSIVKSGCRTVRRLFTKQTGNHGTTPPYGRELPPGRTRKGEVDSDSPFRVFRWIPWLISDYGAFVQMMETQIKAVTILLSALGAFCLWEFRVF